MIVRLIRHMKTLFGNVISDAINAQQFIQNTDIIFYKCACCTFSWYLLQKDIFNLVLYIE